MQLVEDAAWRVLAYIDAVVDHGCVPLVSDVEEYAKAPDPRHAQYALTPALAGITRVFTALQTSGEMTAPAEGTVVYLARMGWTITERRPPRVRTTDLGRALLRALNDVARDTEAPIELVLRSGDPLAYAVLVGRIAGLGRALLVDPYLRLKELTDIALNTTVSRVLVAGNNQEDLTAMAFGVDALVRQRHGAPLEVRALRKDRLHDRLVMPEGGKPPLLLGASVNGVGRSATTVLRELDDLNGVLRAEYEKLWEEASPLTPKTGSSGAGKPASRKPRRRGPTPIRR